MSIMKELSKLEEVKKDKNKKKRTFKGKVELRFLLKSKTINKTKEETYKDMLSVSLRQFEGELKAYYNGKSKIIDDRQTLTELLTNKKFSKALCTVLKEQDELNKVIFFAIADLYASDNKAFVSDQKLVKRYLKVFSKFNEKKIKKLAKGLDIQKMEALHLLIFGHSFKEAKMKIMRRRYQGFLESLYNINDLDVKKATYALNTCFPNRNYQLISYALGERNKTTAEGNNNFNVVTTAILKMLEKTNKDDRKDILKAFAKNRGKNPNYKIRVNLISIDGKYEGIRQTVKRLTDTGISKELFM